MAYLPAIDASPTKMEVVLELLLQSKEKAANLGSEDTDVVMDLAIYAKAVEVLLNPSYKDLKKVARYTTRRISHLHVVSISHWKTVCRCWNERFNLGIRIFR